MITVPVGFALFCMALWSVYVINELARDYFDEKYKIEEDKNGREGIHGSKKEGEEKYVNGSEVWFDCRYNVVGGIWYILLHISKTVDRLRGRIFGYLSRRR